MKTLEIILIIGLGAVFLCDVVIILCVLFSAGHGPSLENYDGD